MNDRLRSAILIVFVVLLDQLTKIYIRASFPPLDQITVIPGFFNIVHAENPGAAFSMLAESPGAWRSFFLVGVSLVVMVIVGAMLWKPPAGMTTPFVRAGLALVFGGAFGNLIDRVFRGAVTDFLQFLFGPYEFPSFNAADSAITIGAALLLLDMLRQKQPASKESPG
jgi:signal peptidase II